MLSVGAWLFRVLPEGRRRSVAVGMMIAGTVMLLPVLLRTWGIIEEGPVTDGVAIGLLIGGAAVCITGFALFRQIKRAGR